MFATKLARFAPIALLGWVGYFDFGVGGPSFSPLILGVAAVHWFLPRTRQDPRRFRHSTLFLLGAFLITFGTGTMQCVQTHQNKELASTIILPLEAYCVENHSLPKTLDDLVPKYIPSVPLVHRGNSEQEIWYIPTQEEPCSYMLRIPGASVPVFGHFYDSQNGRWSAKFD